MAMRKREDGVFPNAAGIDVGASSHWVAVPRHATDDPVREFGAMTDDLNAMADWLIACGVDAVALFCSWLGLCPGTKISGGKVLASGTKRSANRARQALKMAAMSLSHSDSALGAFYRRLCARMDKPRANTAVAHKLARMVYFMLTRGEAFVDQGQHHYEEQQRQRSIAALKRRAKALGFQVNPVEVAA
ncbi:transposase [Cupriavidus sp. D39]|uniref:transposase n=1 Tax=Cupriavidus sp. D39 TaxID=2997877 RepID=UPI002270E33D|nr:transposase [Cupriavidus sp. D39]MCY0853162.1 transposase [Cupriavidus sp. D39]